MNGRDKEEWEYGSPKKGCLSSTQKCLKIKIKIYTKTNTTTYLYSSIISNNLPLSQLPHSQLKQADLSKHSVIDIKCQNLLTLMLYYLFQFLNFKIRVYSIHKLSKVSNWSMNQILKLSILLVKFLNFKTVLEIFRLSILHPLDPLKFGLIYQLSI